MYGNCLVIHIRFRVFFFLTKHSTRLHIVNYIVIEEKRPTGALWEAGAAAVLDPARVMTTSRLAGMHIAHSSCNSKIDFYAMHVILL